MQNEVESLETIEIVDRNLYAVATLPFFIRGGYW